MEKILKKWLGTIIYTLFQKRKYQTCEKLLNYLQLIGFTNAISSIEYSITCFIFLICNCITVFAFPAKWLILKPMFSSFSQNKNLTRAPESGSRWALWGLSGSRSLCSIFQTERCEKINLQSCEDTYWLIKHLVGAKGDWNETWSFIIFPENWLILLRISLISFKGHNSITVNYLKSQYSKSLVNFKPAGELKKF